MQHVIWRRDISSVSRLTITSVEYDRLLASKDVLLHVIGAEEKYNITIENYKELEADLLSLSIEHLAHPAAEHLAHPAAEQGEIRRRKAVATRRVMNFLSSAKLYIDSIGRHLFACCPKCAPMSEFISEQYDQSLAYRVIDSLRNHAQHYEMPIQGITFEAQRQQLSENNFRLDYYVTLNIDVSALKENRKFKKKVISEMECFGGSYELMPLIRDYTDTLARIQKKFRTDVAFAEAAALADIKSQTAAFQREFPDEGLIGVSAGREAEDGSMTDSFYLYLGSHDTYRAFLQQRNRAYGSFMKSHVHW